MWNKTIRKKYKCGEGLRSTAFFEPNDGRDSGEKLSERERRRLFGDSDLERLRRSFLQKKKKIQMQLGWLLD